MYGSPLSGHIAWKQALVSRFRASYVYVCVPGNPPPRVTVVGFPTGSRAYMKLAMVVPARLVVICARRPELSYERASTVAGVVGSVVWMRLPPTSYA